MTMPAGYTWNENVEAWEDPYGNIAYTSAQWANVLALQATEDRVIEPGGWIEAQITGVEAGTRLQIAGEAPTAAEAAAFKGPGGEFVAAGEGKYLAVDLPEAIKQEDLSGFPEARADYYYKVGGTTMATVAESLGLEGVSPSDALSLGGVAKATIPGIGALGAALAGLGPWGTLISGVLGYALGEFDPSQMNGGGTTAFGVPVGGPGVAEPSAAITKKHWSTHYAEFYQLTDGRILVWSRTKGKYVRIYRPAKHIVVPRNPRVGTLLKASKRIDNLWVGINRRTSKYRRRVHHGQFDKRRN